MYICTEAIPIREQFALIDETYQELLAQVASMYYEEDKTQNEIAEALGLSRIKIHRLLCDAKQQGVVKVSIDWPMKRNDALETEIERTFGLSEALVPRTTIPVHRFTNLGISAPGAWRRFCQKGQRWRSVWETPLSK